ncbi:MAG: restriction endonuclease [Blastomonas sp.]
MSDPILWGIHMPHELGLDPVDGSYVAIGWENMGDLSKLTPTRNAFKDQVEATHLEVKPGAIPGAAGVLFRFAVEMQKGDIVIYPSKPNRMVNIGVIDGDYAFEPERHSDYPHIRPVKWITSLSRTTFSQSALNEIGSAITMFRVTSNADEFIAAMEGRELEADDIDDVSADRVSAQVEESTEDFIIKRLKSSQTPYQFEHFVAHLLRCMGYHSRVTQASADGGIDIIAHRDELGFEPPIIKVQCKQILSTIGRPEVQQLHGAIEIGEHGLFVTLGNFSADARTYERGKPNLRLIDGPTLIELIYSHYHEFDPRYQMLLPLKRTYIPGPVLSEVE